jgi:sec-independent protein translocase protein TatA
MGLDNPLHIAFILILVLLVFGAKRLPEMGKSLGAGMRGFRDSLSGESATPPHGAELSSPVPATVAVPTPVAEPSGDGAAPVAREPGTHA